MSNKDISDSLKTVLSDTYILYFKTHSFHWNVKGSRFRSLHNLFEEQYTEMWEALDDIAERIRQLGEHAPNNTDEMTAHAKAISPAGQTPDAEAMIEALADDNRAIVKTLKECAKVANDNDDLATEDMMIERMQAHEEAAWMLESSKAV